MPIEITQKTFNYTVWENIVRFGISREESIQHTLTQFISQGADLCSIDPEVLQIINPVEILKEQLLSPQYNCCEKVSFFKSLYFIIKKGKAFQVYCGKCGIYTLCLELLSNFGIETALKYASLECLIALHDGYPDLLEETGIQLFLLLLDSHNVTYQKYGLNLIRVTCVGCEKNRERYILCDIGAKLASLLQQQNDEILCLVSRVVDTLMKNDDLSTSLSDSYNNAIKLAEHLMKPFCNLLNVKKDPITQYYLVKTLTLLSESYSSCYQITCYGGLDATMKVLAEAQNVVSKSLREQLVTQCFKFIRSIIWNDYIKNYLIDNRLAEEIHHYLAEFINVKNHVKHVFLLISKMTWGTPEYGELLFALNFAYLIVQGMKNFPNDIEVQCAGCYCIINMSYENPSYHRLFLELRAEKLLRNALKVHVSLTCARSALQILGCDGRAANHRLE